METTDRQILSLLSRDGRISYTDIGRQTGLSTSAAQQRVRRLEQRGIITGYHASVDPEAVGLMLMAIVSLHPRDFSVEGDVVAAVADLPEVTSCFSVAGDASHLLVVHVATPGDLELLLGKIRTAAQVSTHTQLVLSVPFADRPLV